MLCEYKVILLYTAMLCIILFWYNVIYYYNFVLYYCNMILSYIIILLLYVHLLLIFSFSILAGSIKLAKARPPPPLMNGESAWYQQWSKTKSKIGNEILRKKKFLKMFFLRTRKLSIRNRKRKD